MEYNYENSYWCNKGQYKDLADELNKLIPSSVEVKKPKSPKLERFRKVQNAYYDLFNNGGGNRRQAVSRYFGVYAHETRYYMNHDSICRRTEPVIDQAILEAAKEQGLV